ncbi:hypothetical protein FQR65_LT03949 [Abscondita terminalis]|nr:hypothetical protein FQR65_LT03949 [Abscondita terminalis]
MPPVFACCVVNCDADAKSTRKLRFPKDLVLFRKWIEFSQRTNLENMDVEKVRNNYRICDYHFAPEYMVDNNALIVQDEPVNLTMESISSPRPQFDFEVAPGPSHEHKHPNLLDRLTPNVGTRRGITVAIRVFNNLPNDFNTMECNFQ